MSLEIECLGLNVSPVNAEFISQDGWLALWSQRVQGILKAQHHSRHGKSILAVNFTACEGNICRSDGEVKLPSGTTGSCVISGCW